MQDMGKRLDEMVQDLKRFKDRAKVEYADEIEELKKNKDTLKEEFDDFREKHKDRLDDIQSNLENAAQEIGKAIEAAFKKRDKPPTDEENTSGQE